VSAGSHGTIAAKTIEIKDRTKETAKTESGVEFKASNSGAGLMEEVPSPLYTDKILGILYGFLRF